ncbi:GRAS domain-containing protein [Cephalotus follicularis]|uniref:GRAS domain-containing protein n=1 Tax=Cephalotus follicularis TaxID=3775 RepID=A0A1Q3CAE0_CEPFO|nr:GRAS domain-containing protein [Cephalotus follicularis]
MKAMPLPFEEFQGKGVLNLFASSSSLDSIQPQTQQQYQKWQSNLLYNNRGEGRCYVGSEPTSVLDTRRSPSPPTSSSTLSSSLGSGGVCGGPSIDTTGVAAASNPSLEIGSAEKCGLGMEDWEGVLSGGSPSHEQSILRLIMGDIEDSSLGLNNLQGSSGSHDMEFHGGFGVVDHAFGFEPNLAINIDPSLNVPFSDFPHDIHNNSNVNVRLGSVSNLPVSLQQGFFQQQSQQPIEGLDEKPQILNPQVIMNQNQAQFAQNPAMFLPLSYAQMQERHLLPPPPPKRLNTGGPNYQVPKVPFLDSGQELFIRRQQQQQQQQHQLQFLQQRSATMKQRMAIDEMANQQLHQVIIDQISKAAELIDTGNSVLAQGILARLNQQLSPIGKPMQRAAFYFTEALQLLLHMNSTNSLALSSSNMIFKVGAYKLFSEISPILQFANFTCNQALLEALEGFDRIHIVDFDVGYGGQWASLMQELVMRKGGAPSLKITVCASPLTHDELELGFTQENLKHFAREINMPFDIEIVSLESMNSASWPLPLRVSESEAIAVNMPIGSISNGTSTLPLILQFVKQLSPKIVVSLDRGCDRTDVPFPHQVIHALNSYAGLLESLDAMNVNMDALQRIEKFMIQPGIEKFVLGHQRSPNRTPWRSLFLQAGFSPLTFSNFTESQAECLVQRTRVRGFHFEKRQSSLVLCWQRKELISASAWSC